MLKKILVGNALMLVLVLALTGCGQRSEQPIGQSSADPNNNKLLTLNEKLANIDGTEAAQSAVTYFASYVVSNLDTNAPSSSEGLSTQSLKTFSTGVFSRVASIEAAARGKGGLSVQALGEDDMVSPEKLADILGQTDTSSGITAEEIKSTQAVVRNYMPDLAANKDSDVMTPLEASVLAYYIKTGDDGSHPDDSEPLAANSGDLETFVDKLVTPTTDQQEE